MESFCRIAVATWVFLIWMLMFGMPFAIANDDDDKPKHKPPITTPTTPISPAATGGSSNHNSDAFWFGAAGGGLTITALQKTEHPWFYSVGGGIAAVALLSLVSNNMSSNETWSAIGGVVTGATGTGLVFGKNFFGWQTAIKF